MKATIIYPGRFEEPQVFDFPISEYPTEDLDVYGVLDLIYRQCNHVNGEEWIKGKKLHSMSVGDMVLLACPFNRGNDTVTQLFICCGVGWKEAREMVKDYIDNK